MFSDVLMSHRHTEFWIRTSILHLSYHEYTMNYWYIYFYNYVSLLVTLKSHIAYRSSLAIPMPGTYKSVVAITRLIPIQSPLSGLESGWHGLWRG